MDDFNEKLTQLLSDPGSIRQIMDLAASLGANEGSPSNEPPELPKEIPALMEAAVHRDGKQAALVNALLPYLRPSHQARLEHALQVAQLAKLAASVWGRTPLSKEEGSSHV